MADVKLEECPICFEDAVSLPLPPGVSAAQRRVMVVLVSCGHQFCSVCVAHESATKCFVCRTPVERPPTATKRHDSTIRLRGPTLRISMSDFRVPFGIEPPNVSRPSRSSPASAWRLDVPADQGLHDYMRRLDDAMGRMFSDRSRVMLDGRGERTSNGGGRGRGGGPTIDWLSDWSSDADTDPESPILQLDSVFDNGGDGENDGDFEAEDDPRLKPVRDAARRLMEQSGDNPDVAQILRRLL